MTEKELKITYQGLANKRCERCGGKLWLEEDAYGLYANCLCGYNVDLKPAPKPVRPDSEDEK